MKERSRINGIFSEYVLVTVRKNVASNYVRVENYVKIIKESKTLLENTH